MTEYLKNPQEKPPRKKKPRELAVIDQIGCTGCEACLTVCPVDCLEVVPGPQSPELERLVEVHLERCIGCKWCAKVCPWECIPMLSFDEAYAKAPALTLRSVLYGSEGPKAPATTQD